MSDFVRDLLARHGIEAKPDLGSQVDVNARPDRLGDRKVQAVRLAELLRRYCADYHLILDWLRFTHGYPSLRKPPLNPLPEEELEEVARSIAEKPPKFPNMLQP